MSDIIESNEKQTWDQHIANKNNPHSVDYKQVNASPKSLGYINQDFTFNEATSAGSYLVVAPIDTSEGHPPYFTTGTLFGNAINIIAGPDYDKTNGNWLWQFMLSTGSPASQPIAFRLKINDADWDKWYYLADREWTTSQLASYTKTADLLGTINSYNYRSNLFKLGNNPITNTTDDITQNWVNKGPGYAWYTTAGQLTNQPSTWGFLFNVVQGSDCFQLWKPQSTGSLWYRSGNGQSTYFNQDWTNIYDTSNITKSTSDLTAGSSSLPTNHIYLVYE